MIPVVPDAAAGAFDEPVPRPLLQGAECAVGENPPEEPLKHEGRTARGWVLVDWKKLLTTHDDEDHHCQEETPEDGSPSEAAPTREGHCGDRKNRKGDEPVAEVIPNPLMSNFSFSSGEAVLYPATIQ